MKIFPADGGLDLGRQLYSAIGHTDAASVRTWIDSGARLDLANPEGVTTLMCACADGNADIVRAIVESGSDFLLEAQDSHGWTALITAAHRAEAGTLRVLLDAGADPAVKDKMGRDALYYAKGSQDPEKIKIIEDALNSARIVQAATVLQQPVSVRKPLQYKP